MVYTVCHCQQSDKGLQCLPFAAVWSVSTLFSILRLISVYSICHSQQPGEGLHYLPFLLSSIVKVYTTCHSQQSDQGLHYLPFSAVWSSSRPTLSFSGTVWSGSTLIAILSSLIKVYTVCHSQLSDQCLHYLPFSAIWSGSTLYAILSSMITVYNT